MKRCFSVFGVVALVALAACQRETDENVVTPSPGYDPATNTVKTQFVLNVSTESQDTKTTSEFVQHNKPFLGMEAVHLLAYSLDYSNAAHGAFLYNPFKDGSPIAPKRDYNLGTLFDPGDVTAENASRTIELSLPLGTNALVLYGKAIKTHSDDLQGKVVFDGNPSDITSLYFSLQPRMSSQAAFDVGSFFFSSVLNYLMIAGLVDELNFWHNPTGTTDRSYKFWWPIPSDADLVVLNTKVPNPVDGDSCDVTGDENPDYFYYAGELSWKQLGTMYDYEYDDIASTFSGEVVTTKNGTKMMLSPLGEALGHAYSELTVIRSKGSLKELRAGSASAILRTLQDLYAVVERCASAGPTGWEENAAELMAKQIMDRFGEFFAVYSDGVDFLRTSASGPIDIATLKANLEQHCPPDRWNAYKAIVNTYFNEAYFERGDNEGFPVNVGLPEGAAILSCAVTPDQQSVDQFSYNQDIPAYGFGTTTFPIQSYRYPAELFYYGNSAIRVSKDAKTTDTYPSSIAAWDNESMWTSGWETKTSVKSDTRSVAMINNINYGTALLASTVQFGSTTLYDNNAALHPGESDIPINVNAFDASHGFYVTGVIVGGQADKVTWDFTRMPVNPSTEYHYDATAQKFTDMVFTMGEGDSKVSNEFDKMVFDKVLAPYKVGAAADPIYTMVWDNYDATKAANEQSDVYVGLEIVNNTDQDFWGEMNLVRKGGTFYLLGKLDLAKTLEKARTGDGNADKFKDFDRPYYCYPPFDPATGNTINAPRVFMQDYMTNANLVLGQDCLKHAYVTVPDLRSSQISLGLSIDMSWTGGLTFDVEMGNTN